MRAIISSLSPDTWDRTIFCLLGIFLRTLIKQNTNKWESVYNEGKKYEFIIWRYNLIIKIQTIVEIYIIFWAGSSPQGGIYNYCPRCRLTTLAILDACVTSIGLAFGFAVNCCSWSTCNSLYYANCWLGFWRCYCLFLVVVSWQLFCMLSHYWRFKSQCCPCVVSFHLELIHLRFGLMRNSFYASGFLDWKASFLLLYIFFILCQEKVVICDWKG